MEPLTVTGHLCGSLPPPYTRSCLQPSYQHSTPSTWGEGELGPSTQGWGLLA